MTGIHQPEWGLFYAYCSCGVCGPIRLSRALAEADRRAHASCCSSGAKR